MSDIYMRSHQSDYLEEANNKKTLQAVSFRYGFYLDPQPDDPVVSSLTEAEPYARKLSVDNGGAPVAIWDNNDNTLKLFAGYEDFVPVKL